MYGGETFCVLSRVASQLKKGHISTQEQNLKKNNVTLFSQTLKVEENKVPLVFTNLASGPRYGHSLDSTSCVLLVTFFGFKAYTKHGRNSRNQA